MTVRYGTESNIITRTYITCYDSSKWLLVAWTWKPQRSLTVAQRLQGACIYHLSFIGTPGCAVLARQKGEGRGGTSKLSHRRGTLPERQQMANIISYHVLSYTRGNKPLHHSPTLDQPLWEWERKIHGATHRYPPLAEFFLPWDGWVWLSLPIFSSL